VRVENMRATNVSGRSWFSRNALLPAAAAAAALVVLAFAGNLRAEDTVEDPTESTDEKEKPSEKAAANKSEDAPAKDAKEEKEAGEEDKYGHGQQASLRVGLMLGYKMDFRYPNSPYCAETYNLAKGPDEQLKTCGFGAAPAIDLALGFAIIDSIEPFVFTRIGLTGESRTATNPQFLLGAGVRIYTMSDSRFKIFFEPALAYRGEGGTGNAVSAFNPTGFPLEYKKDLVFHLGIGPQYDFAKAFGVYINSGLDVGVLRSISATLLLNIGVQGRLP
jgi:hypothetical protein